MLRILAWCIFVFGGLASIAGACGESAAIPSGGPTRTADAAAGSSSGSSGASGGSGSSSGPTIPSAGPDLCVAPVAPAGGAYAWQNATILGGGFVTGIEFSPVQSDIIYARTDVGGAYRWDVTAPQHWVAITDWVGRDNSNLMGIESIAPDPVDPNGVYVAAGEYTSTNGVILHSTDQGATWTQNLIGVPMGGNADGRNVGERLAVDPNLKSTLYFASRNSSTTNGLNGLWKSVDSAATWTRLGTPSPFPTAGPPTYGLSFVFFDKRSGSPGTASSTIYLGVSPAATSQTGASLYRTTDGGATWQPVPNEPSASTSPVQYPHHAAMDVTSGTMYFTYNNYSGPNNVTAGAVWKLDTSNDAWTNISPPGSKGGYGGVTVDAAGSVVVSTLDRWPDEIYRTTNGGANWTAIGTPAARDIAGAKWLYFGGGGLSTTGWNGWMGDIEIDPHNPARAIYNTGQGVWWSDDITSSSIHWKFQNQGLEQTVALGLISPSSGAHLLSAVGDIGGFLHSDLGTPSSTGMFSNPVFANTTSIDFAEQHPALVVRVGTTSSSGMAARHGAFSTDGGSTWQPFPTEPNGSGSAGSVAVSADGTTIVWAPQPAGRGATATPSTPAYTLDQGAHWIACAGLPGGAKVAADRVNPNKFYASSGTQLYVSVDGALNGSLDGGPAFAPTSVALPRGGTVRPVSPYSGGDAGGPAGQGDLWVSTGGGLYHSTDGGSTLTSIRNVQSAAAVGFGLGSTCASYPVLYLAGQANGVSGIYRSDDQGVTWTRIDDPQHQFGSISYISGDPRLYGRVYLGSGGRGMLYGDPQ